MTTGQPAPPTPGNRPSQRVLVIIPTFNERENLPLIHGRLKTACPDVHVLVVDDNSPDGTGQLADELAAADPGRTHVMHRTVKNGLGAAYLEGFAWGLSRQYSVLVEMDADGSHAPEQLNRLLDAVDTGADLAIGSRYVDGGTVRNWPWRRWALSRTANTYSRLSLGVSVHDITAGYRAYRREVLEAIDLDGSRLQGLLLPDRADQAHGPQRVRRRRGADYLHRARTRRVQDERIQHSRGVGQGHPMGHRGRLRPNRLGRTRGVGRGQPRRRDLIRSRRSLSSSSSSSTLRRSSNMSQCVRGGLTFLGSGRSPSIRVPSMPLRH